VKFEFIRTEKAHYPVTVMCTVLEVSRSGFHAWLKRPPSARATSDAQLAVQVAASHQRSRRRYGSPRVHADLRARNIRVSRKRVERLMRQNGLEARRKRRFRRTTDSTHTDPIAPNLLARQFDVDLPNTVWVTDVTAIWTMGGWTYLAAMLDLFARRVVGWAMSTSNDTELALDALQRAWRARQPPRGLIHHSDRGSPYASGDYRAALDSFGFLPSMSRKGDCWDNAVAESFFATLRAELVDHELYVDPTQAETSIGDYIDTFYNVERRHSHLGYVNPIEFELRSRMLRTAA
jgi:transposase InsO family protein